MDKMNFRIKDSGWKTYTGPDYLNCIGSFRPFIHCFKVRPATLNKRGDKRMRVWFVGNSIPQLIDDQARITFIREIYKGKNRLIQSFTYQGDKIKVFYTRASAVKAFDELVTERRRENAQARQELSDALAKGDHLTASYYT